MSTQIKYWFNDFQNILDLEKYNKLLPSKEDDYIEKVNTLVRLSIVIGLLTSLINLKVIFLFIPIVTMTITYIIYIFRMNKLNLEKKKELYRLSKLPSPKKYLNIPNTDKNIISNDSIKKLEKYIEDYKCTPPTRDNVFMNALPYDDRNRYEACNHTPELKAKMDSMFDIYPHNSDDIFNRNDGRYAFHTMPNTTYPNNRDSFAQWVYGRDMTCKEGNGEQCYNNMYHGLHNKLGGYER